MSYLQRRQVRGRAVAPWAWDQLSPVADRVGGSNLVLWTWTPKAHKLLSSDPQCGRRTPFVLVGLRCIYAGTEHAVKLCMGPSFALHEYTMSRAARNSAVRTVAMFMIHGNSKGIVMERGKPVNPETCELSLKQIAFEMVRVVQELHSVGIIHGDIKLSNFLVCRDGRVRLCDFETSEYECDCVSHSEMSIPWSRPSLVRNPDKPRVKADDLYSLGLTIWELYTGKVPFVPPGSEGWESLDISEAAEESILAGEQVDLNDILDPEVRSVAASLVSEEVEHSHCQVQQLGAPEK